MYLSYLDSDDLIGLSVDAIASICIKMTPQSLSNGQLPKEVQLSLHSNETNPLGIDTGYEISRVKISLHDNAYALEKPAPPSLINPLAVSSLAWISLISAPLLSKMIESLLANKCVIIYGPRGSGKLEFGRILIDSMAKMFVEYSKIRGLTAFMEHTVVFIATSTGSPDFGPPSLMRFITICVHPQTQ